MKEILIYLLSISSFTLGWVTCEPWINGYIDIHNYWKNEIHICKNIKRPKIEVAIHELWHLHWYKKLTEEQKEEWIKMYEESKKTPWILKVKWFVTFSASLSYEEDYAETFQYLYLWWKETKKSLFIKNIILWKND